MSDEEVRPQDVPEGAVTKDNLVQQEPAPESEVSKAMRGSSSESVSNEPDDDDTEDNEEENV